MIQVKINVSELLQERVIDIQGDEAWLSDIYNNFKMISSDLGPGKISANLRLQPPQYEQVAVSGSVSYEPLLDCSRCSDPIAWPIKIKLNIVFRPASEDIHESLVDLHTDALPDYFIDEDNQIDLEALLNDLLLTELPNQILRRAPQTGQCSICGKDLSKSLVYESHDLQERSPFAVLKDFKTKH